MLYYVCIIHNYLLSYSQAEIHLTLHNGGSEAYKPLEYGNSITIACTIKRDGGTSYKIKSHSS